MASTDAHQRAGVRPSAAVPALAAAGLAMLISTLLPVAAPLLTALVLGVVVVNSRLREALAPRAQAATTKLLLRLGVVLLGLKLPLRDILDIGAGGLLVIVVTVVATYAATIRLGDRLGLDHGFVTLLAAGFSICGAAAIAAVDDVVRAKERYVALAVAMVTVFGSAMILLVPWLGRVLGLSGEETAVWAGASIHEVAQVVAAASIIGAPAIAVATTVKLGRVLLLAPMYAVAARCGAPDAGTGAPAVPWFVVAFALAVAVRSSIEIPAGVLSVGDTVTTALLAAGMFGLGLGIRAKDLWPVPPRALLLAVASTLVAAGTSLALIVLTR